MLGALKFIVCLRIRVLEFSSLQVFCVCPKFSNEGNCEKVEFLVCVYQCSSKLSHELQVFVAKKCWMLLHDLRVNENERKNSVHFPSYMN